MKSTHQRPALLQGKSKKALGLAISATLLAGMLGLDQAVALDLGRKVLPVPAVAHQRAQSPTRLLRQLDVSGASLQVLDAQRIRLNGITLGELPDNYFMELVWRPALRAFRMVDIGVIQGCLTDYVEVGTLDEPFGVVGVAVADLNDDGHQDIVTTSHNGRYAKIYLGDGAMGFEHVQTLSVGTWTYRPTLGDLDGDGDLDLAVPSRATNRVKVFRNGGDGLFSDWQALTTGSEPQHVTMADLDGDGDLDLNVLCNSWSTRQIHSFLNDGSGALANRMDHILALDRTSDQMSGDLDGDGYADLFVSDGYGKTSLLWGNGDGSFDEQQPDRLQGDSHGDLGVGDIDADGDLDLIVVRNGVSVNVYRNDGARSFSLLSSFNFAGTTGYRREVQVVDMDADGFPEIAIAAADPDQVTILHNDGTGHFSLGTTVDGLTRTFFFADLNGDNVQDVVVGSEGYFDALILQGDQCLD